MRSAARGGFTAQHANICEACAAIGSTWSSTLPAACGVKPTPSSCRSLECRLERLLLERIQSGAEQMSARQCLDQCILRDQFAARSI